MSIFLFFCAPAFIGGEREEEAFGEDIISRRRRYPQSFRHGVESRISINAATLSFAFTKANIRGKNWTLMPYDDSFHLYYHQDSDFTYIFKIYRSLISFF